MKRCVKDSKAYFLSGLDGSSDGRFGPVFAPRIHVLNFIRAKSGFLYNAHVHDRMEMIVALRGVYKCLLNGEELSFKPGVALLIQPGDAHQDIYLEGMEYCGGVFSLDSVGRLFKPEAKPQDRLVKFSGAAPLLRARDALADDGSPFSEQLAASAWLAVFWEAVSAAPVSLLAPELVDRVERDAFKKRLLRHFEARLAEPFDLAAMAKSMGVSKSSLSHKCVELLGTSPAKAFLHFRLLRARELLERRAVNVKGASEALGFASQFHFSRAFKRLFGVAPSTL